MYFFFSENTDIHWLSRVRCGSTWSQMALCSRVGIKVILLVCLPSQVIGEADGAHQYLMELFNWCLHFNFLHPEDGSAITRPKTNKWLRLVHVPPSLSLNTQPSDTGDWDVLADHCNHCGDTTCVIRKLWDEGMINGTWPEAIAHLTSSALWPGQFRSIMAEKYCQQRL